ncbi:MAG TPA: oligosaccharide flippase family protein [Verrucomicrobiae bacterium]|nr:oligosaccharide flippase family protein [Verrucomicrobiae bacterium]
MLDIKQLIRNKFLISSGIVLVGSTFANFVNYFYNLVLGRILDPVSYGEVAAYVTLAMIIVVPAGTLATLVTKYISEYSASGDHQKVRAIYRSSVRWALSAGFLLLIIFLALSPLISSYLKTSLTPTIVFAFFLPISLIAASSKGTLQGLHEFFPITVTNAIESLGKLIFAVVFVYLGWGVAGAVGGILAGSILAYLYSIIKIRNSLPTDNVKMSETEPFFKGIPKYVYIIFLSTLCLSVFGNIDVVLAKHYLSEHSAGQYAALAVLGRIVTYGSIAIITVLLPMAAATGNDEKKAKKLLLTSIAFTILIAGVIIFFFYTFPNFTINLLFGADYLEVAPYLGLFGLIMLLGSLSKTFVNYFIARHQTYFIYPFIVTTIVQIILIVLFHENIRQIVNILLITNILLLISQIVIYFLAPQTRIMDQESAETIAHV